MSDAKLDSSSFSSFGDMTPQNFRQKKGMSSNLDIYPQKMGLT